MLRDYDLNLLTVFDAVMTLGSVNRSAEKLNMTSAAVSQNLARLRETGGGAFVCPARAWIAANSARTQYAQTHF